MFTNHKNHQQLRWVCKPKKLSSIFTQNTTLICSLPSPNQQKKFIFFVFRSAWGKNSKSARWWVPKCWSLLEEGCHALLDGTSDSDDVATNIQQHATQETTEVTNGPTLKEKLTPRKKRHLVEKLFQLQMVISYLGTHKKNFQENLVFIELLFTKFGNLHKMQGSRCSTWCDLKEKRHLWKKDHQFCWGMASVMSFKLQVNCEGICRIS